MGKGQTVSDPTGPAEPFQRQLTIASIVPGIVAAIMSIWQGAGSLALAALILATCAVATLAFTGVGHRKLAVGPLTFSWNVLGAAFLFVMLAVVAATSWRSKPVLAPIDYPVDTNASRPRVANSQACIADLKRQYSCHAFRELVSRSKSVLMSHAPEHSTLDDPLELAVAIGQGKMLLEGGGGEYCALYDASISEACNMLAGADARGL